LIIFMAIQRFKKIIKTPRDLIGWSFLVLAVYVIFSPYYSPQWAVWLLPLLILIFNRAREVWAIVIFELLNYLFFPVIYGHFGYEHWLFDVVTVLRTAALFVLLWMVVKKLVVKSHDDNLVVPYNNQG